MQSRPPIRTAAPALLLAACAALLIAACGSSGPGGGGTAGTSTAAAAADAIRFASCMRSHGITDFPDPSSDGQQIQASSSPGGSSSINVDGHTISESAPAFNKAQQECQQYAPKGRALSAAQIAKVRAGALVMAKCMRAHGVPNFPDPKVSTGPGGTGIAVQVGVQGGGAGGLNPQSPAFQAAQKTCQPLMRNLLGRPRTAGSGS